MTRGGQSLERLERASADVVFLSKAARVLASSIELKNTFAHLTEIIVPSFADCFNVSLLERSGKINRLALKHIDPRKNEALLELDRKTPLNQDSPYPSSTVIRTREPILVSKVAPEFLERDWGKGLAEIGLLSFIALPMITGNTVIGAIWFGITEEPKRSYDQDDLRLAIDLTALATQAIHNASLHDSALNELERRAVSEKIREDFIKHQIHDISTPLTTATLHLDRMIQNLSLDPATSALADKARINIRRAVEMVGNLSKPDER
jgi:GAF domain-containing protein